MTEIRKLLLSVDDVAEVIGVSPRKAREVMLSLTHVRVGKLLKIRPEVLEAWIKRGGDEWRGSTFGERHGGHGDTTPTESAGESRRTRQSVGPLSLPRAKSSAGMRLTPRTGHGKRSRSSARSSQ